MAKTEQSLKGTRDPLLRPTTDRMKHDFFDAKRDLQESKSPEETANTLGGLHG